MKNKLLISIISFLMLPSCQEKESPTQPTFPGQYFLVGYRASFSPNPVFIEVSDSLYFYNFFEDGTFQKIIGEEETLGTYEEGDFNGLEGIELTFNDPESNLIHSCFWGREFFSFDEQDRMVGSWEACDGPTLYFEGGSLIQVGGVKN